MHVIIFQIGYFRSHIGTAKPHHRTAFSWVLFNIEVLSLKLIASQMYKKNQLSCIEPRQGASIAIVCKVACWAILWLCESGELVHIHHVLISDYRLSLLIALQILLLLLSELFVSVSYILFLGLPDLVAWKYLSACNVLNVKVRNILTIKKFFCVTCYIIILPSIRNIFKSDIFLFEAKNEQMVLHFAETDEITTGVINNLKNVDALPALQLCFVCGNFGFYCKTILFQTARTIEGSNMFTDHIT